MRDLRQRPGASSHCHYMYAKSLHTRGGVWQRVEGRQSEIDAWEMGSVTPRQAGLRAYANRSPKSRRRNDRSPMPAEILIHRPGLGAAAAPRQRPERKLSFPPSFRRLSNRCYGPTDSGNSIIHGENLKVLRQLRECAGGTVRCVYIDPPYNNQENYRHYSDVRSHDDWLEMIIERLEAIKPLLSLDGSLWISIDDREVHYLKVAADQIFGRENFISTIIWQQRTTRENRRAFSNSHEYLLVYAANSGTFRTSRNLLPAGPELLARYRNPDSDPRGPWQSVSANVQDGHATATQYYELVAPNGTIHHPPEGRCWVYTREKMRKEIEAGNVWFGKDGCGVPRLKRFLRDSQIGLTPETLWKAEEVGTTDEAKKQLLKMFPDAPVFDTPKPERLVARIIQIASDEGDLVLDSFLGSGTTAAVAHKLNRSYIGIEQDSRSLKLSTRRLRSVIDGETSGCSDSVGWVGGGGFEFYRGPA